MTHNNHERFTALSDRYDLLKEQANATIDVAKEHAGHSFTIELDGEALALLIKSLGDVTLEGLDAIQSLLKFSDMFAAVLADPTSIENPEDVAEGQRRLDGQIELASKGIDHTHLIFNLVDQLVRAVESQTTALPTA